MAATAVRVTGTAEGPAPCLRLEIDTTCRGCSRPWLPGQPAGAESEHTAGPCDHHGAAAGAAARMLGRRPASGRCGAPSMRMTCERGPVMLAAGTAVRSFHLARREA